jgi:hypothetical protein
MPLEVCSRDHTQSAPEICFLEAFSETGVWQGSPFVLLQISANVG